MSERSPARRPSEALTSPKRSGAPAEHGLRLARSEPDADGVTPPRVLAAFCPAPARSHLKRKLARAVETLDFAPTQRDLERALAESSYDIVLLGDEIDWATRTMLIEQLGAGGEVSPVAFTGSPTLEAALAAMRAGAADIIDQEAPEAELITRLASATARARLAQARQRDVERLQGLCRRLDADRNEITGQLSSLCSDLAGAYEEMSGQIDQVTVASEFGAMVRQELDVESLLRTALEFILAQVGPTNAAIFLPSTSGDWSLGAYVNYDRPRDTIDVLLDGLGASLAPAMAREETLLMLPSAEDFGAVAGDESVWLDDCGAIIFSCHEQDECLAVVCLFRDERAPFEPELRATIQTVAALFGRQLGRIVHIHHRHMPKDQWGAFESDADDGWDDGLDLAA